MREKRKFNGFDLLLIVVLVALVVGVVFKFTLFRGETASEENQVTVEYTLEITPWRQYSVDMLQVGDTLYFGSDQEEVGTIAAIEIQPATGTMVTEEGEVVEVEVEDRYTAIVTVRAEAKRTSEEVTAYEVGNITLLKNRSDLYLTKYLAFTGNLLDFTVEE